MKKHFELILTVGLFLCTGNIVYAESIWQDKGANFEKRVDIAHSYLKKGQGEKALSETEMVIKNNPDLFEAYAVKTMICLEMNKWDNAIESSKEMIRLAPDNFAAHLGLGQAYGGKRLFDDAIQEFKEAIRIKPDDPGAYYYLGFAYVENGQKDKAKEVHDRLKTINTEAAEALGKLIR